MLKNLLSTPTAQLGRAGRFAVFQIKLWSHCARLLKKNRAGQQAAAISYHTIFGLIPLVIVMLLIFQSFPAYSEVGEKLKDFIYKQARFADFTSDSAVSQDPEKTVALTEHLDDVVGDFFTRANTGAVTFISIFIVIWAAIALLSTIERAFNNIWHVGRGRSFLHRVINYWAVLTLCPLILGVGIYASTQYAALVQLQKTVFGRIAPLISSYLIAMVAFFLLYFVLPNSKVKAKSAIWGAAVAAIVWIGAKNIFGYYVIGWKPYGTVYGAMALIPITVLWIYITWLIVLFGLQLTFTTQHLKSLDAAEIATAGKIEDYFIASDFSIINIVAEVASAFEDSKAPVDTDVISSKLNMPAELVEKISDYLVTGGIFLKVSEPKAGFIPSRDPENIRLSDISEAIANVEFGQQATQQASSLTQISQSQRDALAQYNIKQILNR